MANVKVNGTTYNNINEVRLLKSDNSGEQNFVLPPSGSIDITANSNNINVANYATANVNVPTGITPTGTKSITANGTYDVTNFASANVNVSGSAPVLQQKSVTAPASGTSSVTPDTGYDGLSKVTVSPTPTETKSINANGTYTPTSGKHFSQVTVNVSGDAPQTQEKTVTPPASTQTVTPDSGKFLSKVTVNGDADLVAGNIKSGVDIFGVTGSYTGGSSSLTNLTVTPSETQQDFYHTGYDGYDQVTVNAISSNYVGSGVARKTSSDLTTSGAIVNVPAGYYASAASKEVTSGTAGTPSAAKGAVSNHAITVTPSVTNTTGYITGGTKSGTGVTVSASELVSGSETKTTNGTYDVTNLSQIVVNVSGGSGGTTSIEPTSDTWQHNTYVTLTVDIDEEGNLSIRQSAGGGTTAGLKICYPQGSSTEITKIPNIPTDPGDYTLPITASWSGDSNNHTLNYTVVSDGPIVAEPLTVTRNGTYTAPRGIAYTPVTVSVSSEGGGIDSKEITPTTSTGASVSITGLLGQPIWFILFSTATIPAASGSRRIISHYFNGVDEFGNVLISSGSSWSVTYSVAADTTNFSHTYSNGTLTLSSNSSSTGGAYYNVQYVLVYEY